MANPKVPSIPMSRGHLDKLFKVALLFNSVAAVGSVILFFLSSWWIFLLLGTIGLPFLIGAFLLYRYTSLKLPMQRYASNFVYRLYNKILTKRESFLRRLYTTICWIVPTEEWKHIDWGYAALNPNGQLNPEAKFEHEDKKFYYQLYQYLATGMGNWNTLEGKNLLEVRTGGGGGLNYLTENLNPNKAIGVDASSTQIAFCKKSHGENPKMKFYTADALETVSHIGELADQGIDLVISVQSSKHMSDFQQFVQDIDSIIKPGGVLAFADLRPTEDWKQLEEDLSSASLRILKKEDITNNVVQALKLDEIGKWQTMNRWIGSILRRSLRKVGVVKDSPILESLNNGSNVAMAYLLHKVPQSNIPW